MSKKKKIIIGIVCAVLIISGIVTGIILATIKRFDISTTNRPEYRDNNHMIEVTLDNRYYIDGNFFLDGGLTKINDTSKSDNNQGYYNFTMGEMVIPAEYNISSGIPTSDDNLEEVTITSTSGEKTSTIFKITKNENEITYLNNRGENTNLTQYDSEKAITYGKIKEKVISLKNKNGGVKAKVKNDFITKQIEITNIEFDRCYYMQGYFNYEVWNLTDTEDNTHSNIYSVKSNGERKLVQTISNNIGVYPSTDLSTITFLTDGEIRFVTATPNRISDDSSDVNINFQIFNADFEEENTFDITFNEDRQPKIFSVGNSFYIQEKIPTNEKKYDFSENDGNNTHYYKIETYKINLKSGKKSKVNFDYLVSSYKEVTPKTTILTAQKIKSKILQTETTFLINERLQVKEIGYTIDSLFRVSKDRYIVKSQSSLILIDKRYNQIANLGMFDQFFTTNSSIILSDSDYSYVTSHDGIVVKKYKKDQIVNIYDDAYYLVKVNVTRGDQSYTEHYLENLGKRISSPIYSINHSESTYNYNNKAYDYYHMGVLKGTEETDIKIISRIYRNNNKFTYEFYNIHGKLLNTIDNVESATKSLQLCYQDNDMAIVYFEDGVSGHYYKITN